MVSPQPSDAVELPEETAESVLDGSEDRLRQNQGEVNQGDCCVIIVAERVHRRLLDACSRGGVGQFWNMMLF